MKKIFIIGVVAIAGMILFVVGFPNLLRHRAAAPLTRLPTHGVSFILESEGLNTNLLATNLAMLKSALVKRSERLGMRIYCEPISESRVQVVIRARDSRENVNLKRALFREGRLEFRLVHEDSDRMIKSGEVPPGFEILKDDLRLPSKGRRTEQLIVRKKSELGSSGPVIEEAMVVRGDLGEPQINFKMRPEAAAAFAKVTRDYVGRRLAIVVDGQLYSAPVINSPIETGTGQITGGFEVQEAFEIAGMLDSPLPISVQVVESKTY